MLRESFVDTMLVISSHAGSVPIPTKTAHLVAKQFIHPRITAVGGKNSIVPGVMRRQGAMKR